MSTTARDKAWVDYAKSQGLHLHDADRQIYFDGFDAGRASVTTVEVHHFDIEMHAKSFNEGYEAAMTQHLADDPTAADDWLAVHDAEVRASVLSALTEERIARALWGEATEEGDDPGWTWGYLVERANRGDGDYSEIREGWFRAARAVLALIEQETTK